jgi:hypothetical protein
VILQQLVSPILVQFPLNVSVVLYLVSVQGKLTEFKGLKDDVRTLKESLIDATDSLGPQLSRLKDKMIDFAAKFQSQSTAQSSIYILQQLVSPILVQFPLNVSVYLYLVTVFQ